jgi:hypothetical protein
MSVRNAACMTLLSLTLTYLTGCGDYLNGSQHAKLAEENHITHIAGQVVDFNGKTVTEVHFHLRVTTYHYDQAGILPYKTEEKDLDVHDGTFNINFDHAADVRILATKDGYQITDVLIYTKRPYQPNKDYQNGFGVDPTVESRDDVKVVMRDAIQFNPG